MDERVGYAGEGPSAGLRPRTEPVEVTGTPSEEELLASYRHLASILESMLDAVIVANPDGTIRTVNRAALELLGYSEEEIIGQSVGMIFEEEEEEEEEEAAFFRGTGLVRLVREGAARDVELTLRTSSGGRIPVVFNGSVIREEDGRLAAVVGVARDMRETRRLWDEILRAEATLRSLNAAALTVQRALEPEDVFKAVASELRKLGLLTTIFLLDEDKKNLTISYMSFSPELIKAAEKLLGLSRNIRFALDRIPQYIKEVLGNRVTVFSQASDRIEGFLPPHLRGLAGKLVEILGLQKGIIAPLVVEGEVIGALGVDSQDLTENDVPAITAFANQVSIAIENARLYQAEQRGREVAEALQETARVVNTSLNPDEVLSLILEQLARVIQYDSAAVLLLNDGRFEVTAARGFADMEAALRLSFGTDEDNLPSAVTRARHPLIVEDVQDDPRWQPDPAITHIHGWIGAPLIVRDKVIGILTVDSRRPGAYSEEDGRLVFAFANQAAIAIENARLYEAVKQELADRTRAEQALRESQRFLEEIADATPNMMIYLYNLIEQRNVYVNRQIGEILGYTKEEIQQMGSRIIEILVHPDDSESVTEHMKRVAADKKGEIIENEYRMKHANGEWRWLLSRDVVFTRNADGSPRQNIGVAIDITKGKRAEEELRESEERYRLLFERNLAGVYTTTLYGDILDCNEAFTQIFGYDSREELLAHEAWELYFDAADREEFIAQLRQEGALLGREWLLRRKDGSPIWVLENSNLIEGEEGRPTFLQGTSIDITERKRAEKKLIRLSNAVKMSTDSIVISDLEAKIIDVNEATLRMYGTVDRRDLIGRSSFDLITAEDREKAAARVQEVLEKGYIRGEEYYIITKDGSRIPVEMSAALMKDADGKPIGFVGVSRDITERKRAEEQIKASLKEKELLLREIHHRVKNNLQVVSSLLDFQSEYIEDKQTLEVFKESQNRVRSMALIHEQLYQSEGLARIDFAEYVQNLAAHLFRSYGVTWDAISLKINVDNVLLGVDTAIPCGLIIGELVSNSLKYAFPGGRACSKRSESKGEIRIDLHSDDDKLTLIVSDNGVGFPEDLDFPNTETLGLRLVNMLTRQLKGAIELDRSGGTTFKITFARPKR